MMRPDVVPAEALRLPADWRGQPAWCVLEIGGASSSLDLFLLLWRAWRQDPHRPCRLHHVALAPAAAVVRGPSESGAEDLEPLAAQLHAQCWGLTRGWHRLSFERGQVLLTLCLGDPAALLREQRFEADSILLHAAAAEAVSDPRRLKSLLRCCRRGARLSAPGAPPGLRRLLACSGFDPQDAAAGALDSAGVPWHGRSRVWSARFEPHWLPRRRHDADADAVSGIASDSGAAAAAAVVIGAGLAGAAVAAGLARRGRRVCVLDAAPAAAAGASGLPAGLFAPHVSADDGVLSRLTRAGIRLTLAFAHEHLAPGTDWQPGGVLERRGLDDGPAHAPLDIAGSPDRDWSEPATPQRKAAAGLPASAPALWHAHAGWIRPARLVDALLADPLIEFRGTACVDRVVPGPAGWRLLDAQSTTLAESPLVVIAAGPGSALLVPGGSGLPLRPAAGQLSFAASPPHAPLPPLAVNGHGSFVSGVTLPHEATPCWIAGASYRRDDDGHEPRTAEHADNLSRLRVLLPGVAGRLAPAFAEGRVHAWTGVRCTTPDRLPVVGPLAPGLWVSSALGSRGLSFALLCAELLAARLGAEPWPLPPRLARALDARRFDREPMRSAAGR